jgi:hypothetical protein
MPTAAKKPEPEKPTPPPAVLGDAGASTNPLVHKALADLETAERNDDKDAVKAAKAQLAELGVSV